MEDISPLTQQRQLYWLRRSSCGTKVKLPEWSLLPLRQQGPADSPREEKVALVTSQGIMQNIFNLKMDLNAKFSVIKKKKFASMYRTVSRGIRACRMKSDATAHSMCLQCSVTLSTKDSLHWRLLKDAQGAGLFWCACSAKIWHLVVSSKMSIELSSNIIRPGMVDITCNVATELTISLSIDCHTTPMMVDPDKDF